MGFFDKKDKERDKAADAVYEIQAEPKPRGEKVMSNRPSGETSNALLGRGAEFEGKLSFEGTVRIEGKFRGEIRSSDTLVIGEGAIVEADIDVSNVVVYGLVKGNLRADSQAQFHAPARFYGDIATKSLAVEPGVIIEGAIHMDPESARS